MDTQKIKQQKILLGRIDELCQEKNYSYYILSCKSGIPLSTLMNIMNGTSKNPSIFSIFKICVGLEISLKDFFDTEDFEKLFIECEEE